MCRAAALPSAAKARAQGDAALAGTRPSRLTSEVPSARSSSMVLPEPRSSAWYSPRM